jgi:hypothetical protein
MAGMHGILGRNIGLDGVRARQRTSDREAAPSSTARSFTVQKLRGMKWFRWVVVWWVKVEVEGGEVERERVWEKFCKVGGRGAFIDQKLSSGQEHASELSHISLLLLGR